jgi:starch phosphorylase
MTIDKAAFKEFIRLRLKRRYGKDIAEATRHDIYDAASSAAMEYVLDNWMATRKAFDAKPVKQMFYLSAEFLVGRVLGNNLINLGVLDEVKEVLDEIGFAYSIIEEEEPDAGLGNGGLGRLAACFLDSLASLDLPGHGYGIRYRYGMFEQAIEKGRQVEKPDNWLDHRDPWAIKRSDLAVEVKLGGEIVVSVDANGRERFSLRDAEIVRAIPHDLPIVGYGTKTVNTLRLWEASSPDGFDLQLFNDMHYHRAVQKANQAEDLTRVLYPNDSGPSGKALRLKQQYFFVSASLQDILRGFKARRGTAFDQLPEFAAVQLNDTHPVVAIPEMMRLLMDEEALGWEAAWAIVTRLFAYTNHTIMTEALEKWPIDLFCATLPRLYAIIEEIDRRHQDQLRGLYPDDWQRRQRMSIVEGGMVHMARLAIVGSFSINGVAALHTEILKKRELRDWYDWKPDAFNNKTNGVTQRRWLLAANPGLANLITSRIGPDWVMDLTKLRALETLADDPGFRADFAAVKRANKAALAEYLGARQGAAIDPDSIFDVQVKRLHEYKRQLLNILHVMFLHNRLADDPTLDPPPRTFIFGAKAASGYRRAKSIIALINAVAERLDADPRVRAKLKVVFAANYRVTLAEKIIPAADVSEQISTAGKEASGTGNMKLMMNGALTIGTMDGANVEIVKEVGRKNAFVFGLGAEEIAAMEATHSYDPRIYLGRTPALARVVHQLVDGTFAGENQGAFREIYDSLLNGVDGNRPDPYYVLADFDAYRAAQEAVEECYLDQEKWVRTAILNVARSGVFSSDRTIREYAADIWKIGPVKV